MWYKNIPVRVVITILAGLFITILLIASNAASSSKDERTEELKQRFVTELSEDFDSRHIRNLFENLGYLYRRESGLCLFLRESVDEDIQRKRRGEKPITGYLLTEPHSLMLGILYYQKHREYFNRAEQKFGVPPEVILGIFRMETWFGECVGQFNALPALFYTYMNKAKSFDWVLREMRAIIDYCARKGCDPNTLSSSKRGAIGYSQFMPTNIVPKDPKDQYTEDGDGNGVINLFTHPDAILSTARFLFMHGWVRGTGSDAHEKQRKAVWHYNKTYTGYVDPVFKYADAIREGLLSVKEKK